MLLVAKPDRLARSTRDLLNTLDAVVKPGAGFRSLGDPWSDTTTPRGKLMMTGGLAEFERHLILARTDEGRQRAKRSVQSQAQAHQTSTARGHREARSGGACVSGVAEGNADRRGRGPAVTGRIPGASLVCGCRVVVLASNVAPPCIMGRCCNDGDGVVRNLIEARRGRRAVFPPALLDRVDGHYGKPKRRNRAPLPRPKLAALTLTKRIKPTWSVDVAVAPRSNRRGNHPWTNTTQLRSRRRLRSLHNPASRSGSRRIGNRRNRASKRVFRRSEVSRCSPCRRHRTSPSSRRKSPPHRERLHGTARNSAPGRPLPIRRSLPMLRPPAKMKPRRVPTRARLSFDDFASKLASLAPFSVLP